MPLQNRVTPDGSIVALPQRGLFTGNRGIIHDPATRTLLARRWASRAWLICACEFRGRRRDVMAGRSWTELFFLDEATALAAGHRPCFFCRREAAERFHESWAAGNAVARLAAGGMDRVLHVERLDGRAKRLHTPREPAETLPEGAMLASGSNWLLVANGRWCRWTPEGYRRADPPPLGWKLLTPPSTLRALAAGYQPVLHPSAGASPDVTTGSA